MDGVFEDVNGFFTGKRVAVTGAAGTVGSELVRQLLALPTAEVRALDNHETGLFFLTQQYANDDRFQTFLCDIRSDAKLKTLFGGMDYIFHAAAIKHVPLAERSPFEATQTNIIGVQNIIRAANECGCERVLFTSSDKAVNPTNVMGTTKLMGERLITAANALRSDRGHTIFTSTRFGNVAGSAGSVIPLFCKQIAKGQPITLTDPEMTRFVMTLDESVRLVMRSMEEARGGEVFVTKMPVVRIIDLARVIVDMVAPAYGRSADEIEVKVIGSRPGEKLYEELTTDEEMRRSLEMDDLFVVLPAFRNIYGQIDYSYSNAVEADRVYNSASEPVMSLEEVREFLMRPSVLPDEVVALLPKSAAPEVRKVVADAV